MTSENDWKVLQQIAIEKLAKEFREEHDKQRLTWWYAQTEQNKNA